MIRNQTFETPARGNLEILELLPYLVLGNVGKP